MQQSVNIQLAKEELIRFVANVILIYVWIEQIEQSTVLENIIQSKSYDKTYF